MVHCIPGNASLIAAVVSSIASRPAMGSGKNGPKLRLRSVVAGVPRRVASVEGFDGGADPVGMASYRLVHQRFPRMVCATTQPEPIVGVHTMILVAA